MSAFKIFPSNYIAFCVTQPISTTPLRPCFDRILTASWHTIPSTAERSLKDAKYIFHHSTTPRLSSSTHIHIIFHTKMFRFTSTTRQCLYICHPGAIKTVKRFDTGWYWRFAQNFLAQMVAAPGISRSKQTLSTLTPPLKLNEHTAGLNASAAKIYNIQVALTAVPVKSKPPFPKKFILMLLRLPVVHASMSDLVKIEWWQF